MVHWTDRVWLASMARGEITLVYSFMTVGTWKTRRKLGRVNFRKDFWGCYWAKGKNWPIADRRVPSNDPRNNCGTHFGASPLLFSKVAHSFTLSLAHCIVCSITAGNDLSVQWGTSSSGGSRLKRDTYKMIPNNYKKTNNSLSFWVGSHMDDWWEPRTYIPKVQSRVLLSILSESVSW